MAGTMYKRWILGVLAVAVAAVLALWLSWATNQGREQRPPDLPVHWIRSGGLEPTLASDDDDLKTDSAAWARQTERELRGGAQEPTDSVIVLRLDPTGTFEWSIHAPEDAMVDLSRTVWLGTWVVRGSQLVLTATRSGTIGELSRPRESQATISADLLDFGSGVTYRPAQRSELPASAR